MELNTVIIDTNAYSEFKRGNNQAISIIKKVDFIILTPIVIGELLAGFALGSKEEKNRNELQEFKGSKKVISVQIDENTSKFFALIYKELRQKGKPIPTNDLWIASIAKQLNCPLFTYDNHFENINGLRIVS